MLFPQMSNESAIRGVAIAGCSHDLPTIGLMGISMGLTAKASDLQNKRYLVPTLEFYARAGFGFIIAFDADAATNSSITWEQRKLGRQLLKFGVPVRSVTAQWEPGTEGETKGMDDFIQKKGIEEFRRMLVKSISFEDWESNLDTDENHFTASKPPTPRQLARQLAETAEAPRSTRSKVSDGMNARERTIPPVHNLTSVALGRWAGG